MKHSLSLIFPPLEISSLHTSGLMKVDESEVAEINVDRKSAAWNNHGH